MGVMRPSGSSSGIWVSIFVLFQLPRMTNVVVSLCSCDRNAFETEAIVDVAGMAFCCSSVDGLSWPSMLLPDASGMPNQGPGNPDASCRQTSSWHHNHDMLRNVCLQSWRAATRVAISKASACHAGGEGGGSQQYCVNEIAPNRIQQEECHHPIPSQTDTDSALRHMAASRGS